MDPYAKGSYLMTHILLLNSRRFNRLLKEESALFTSEQGKLMVALAENGPMTTTELSQHTGFAKNTLSVMMGLVIKNGLVEKVKDTKDHRRFFLQLTDLGKSQHQIGRSVSKEVGQAFYAGFTDDEIGSFESYLQRILDNVRNIKEIGDK